MYVDSLLCVKNWKLRVFRVHNQKYTTRDLPHAGICPFRASDTRTLQLMKV